VSRLRPKPTAEHATLFKALADETRLEILGLLAAAGGSLCVCDIESHVALAQPTVSHHLRVLREAGCLRAERRGVWVHYEIDPTCRRRLEEFCNLMGRDGT